MATPEALISKDDLHGRLISVLDVRFEPILRVRWLFGIAAAGLSVLMLEGDHSVWRRWALVVALAAGVARQVLEKRGRHLNLMLDVAGRRRLSGAAIISLSVGAAILGSGGFDSPGLPIVIPVCFFYGIVASPGLLAIITASLVAFVAVLAGLSGLGLVPDMLPVGLGEQSGAAPVLVYSKAVGIALTIVWAALVASVVQRVFGQVFSEAVDARDEVLEGHAAHAKELTALSQELAHELKNPLANVRGLAVLVGRDVHGKGVERLQVLQREVERMGEILQEFLTFSRPLSPLNAEAVDLPVLCRAVLALLEGAAYTRGVRVELSASGPMPVWCDERKVKQILINLVQNAIEASPRDAAVTVAVGAHGERARVEVRDEGTGIPEAVRAHLFEAGTTTKARGTGLGLALARGLARQHGGELTLENRPEGGCLAVLELPARPAATPVEATA